MFGQEQLACPPDSSWNTPSVSPVGDHVVDAGVVHGDVLAASMSAPPARIMSSVSRMTVSVRRPRKSIFRRPSALQRAHGVLGGDHVVVGLQGHVFAPPGSAVISTPAAWVEAWRGMPSSLQRRVDQLAARCSSLSIQLRAAAEMSSSALSSVMSSSKGISLGHRVRLGDSSCPAPGPRPGSRRAAAMVPKVMICAT